MAAASADCSQLASHLTACHSLGADVSLRISAIRIVVLVLAIAGSIATRHKRLRPLAQAAGQVLRRRAVTIWPARAGSWMMVRFPRRLDFRK